MPTNLFSYHLAASPHELFILCESGPTGMRQCENRHLGEAATRRCSAVRARPYRHHYAHKGELFGQQINPNNERSSKRNRLEGVALPHDPRKTSNIFIDVVATSRQTSVFTGMHHNRPLTHVLRRLCEVRRENNKRTHLTSSSYDRLLENNPFRKRLLSDSLITASQHPCA